MKINTIYEHKFEDPPKDCVKTGYGLPIINLPNYRAPIMYNNIMCKIKGITHKSKILCCFIFGSSVKQPQIHARQKEFLWWKWTSTEVIKTANDVDILVLIDDKNIKEVIEKWETELPIGKKREGSYGGTYLAIQTVNNSLHILIASISQFKKALDEGDRDALGMINPSIFITGYRNVYDNLITNYNHTLRS